jgi:uncharacterized hydantoinase/oxoprolinase family protein
MLEKKVVIDKIEVLEDGHIQVRQKTSVLEDGKELSYNYHRWVLSPDVSEETLNKQEKKVKDIAGVVLTKEVKDAYKAKKAEK